MNLKEAAPLIEPVPRELLRQELTTDCLVRSTRIGSNEVYIFTALNAPNLMQEVGRLRELTFRDAGAGFVVQQLILIILIRIPTPVNS